jgi:hypothetical protein
MWERVVQAVPDKATEQLWSAIDSNRFERVQRSVDTLRAQGFAASDVLQRFSEDLLRKEGLSDLQRAKVAICAARVAKALGDGADERLQLLELAAFAARVLAGWDGGIDADEPRTYM